MGGQAGGHKQQGRGLVVKWLVINAATYEPTGPFSTDRQAAQEAVRMSKKLGGAYTVQPFVPRKPKP